MKICLMKWFRFALKTQKSTKKHEKESQQLSKDNFRILDRNLKQAFRVILIFWKKKNQQG